jgi:hypothetical protein
MLGEEKRDPRSPGDRRMYFYFDYSPLGSLRWYVKVSRKGRRIGITGEYGTEPFDAAYDAAVAALGGVMRKRRTEPDPLVQPERRYVQADRSQRGQTRYYVQLRNGLPKIRIKAEFGTNAFNDECDAAIAAQIGLYGDATDHINAHKQRNESRAKVPTDQPKPHTLRWYWMLYKQSDHWLGDFSVGHVGLSDSTRLQRTGLIESLLPDNGEKPFAVLTRQVIKAEMKARTPSQAGNMLSALRGMIRWMIDDGHLDEDDDPTPDRAQDGSTNCDREKPRQHERDGAGASRVCRKPAGGARSRYHRRGRIHWEDREGPSPANEQEGMGNEVQEVRGPGRRERAEERLPWRSQGAGRGRGLRRLHREPDDGDVRLDRPENAGALHRQGEPGKARHEWHGEDRGVRHEPIIQRAAAGARREQGRNAGREQSSNFAQ